MSDERERVAEELRRVREEVRKRAQLVPDTDPELPAPRPLTRKVPAPAEPVAPPPPPPAPPDAAPVNAAWRAEPAARGGFSGLCARILERFLGPRIEAQVAFNSRQVQLDNEILDYVDARLDATHRHYDAVLGVVGRHLGEIDERHLILQEELVAHVHDLVKRIDLVLAEAERARRASSSPSRTSRRASTGSRTASARMKTVLVCAVQAPFVTGGAEILVGELGRTWSAAASGSTWSRSPSSGTRSPRWCARPSPGACSTSERQRRARRPRHPHQVPELPRAPSPQGGLALPPAP